MSENLVKKPLDDHDEAIIGLLREDGRMAVRTIAERVGLNEATVRTRIRRLEQAGIMRVVARVDLGSAGYPFSAVVGLRIKGRSIDEVGQDLLAFPEIISILSVIGRNDLEIQIIAPTTDALNELLTNRIPAISGIVSLESALALKIHKYVQPWGRFDEGN
jgi:Lrp/AsnC family transcriptional regulator for asnA, asnC and gidA